MRFFCGVDDPFSLPLARFYEKIAHCDRISAELRGEKESPLERLMGRKMKQPKSLPSMAAYPGSNK